MRQIALFIILPALSGCAQIPPAEVPAPSPSQRQLVVFDIDGTLTPQNLSVFEPRPGAAQAASALSAKGYKVVYLTTRVPLFQSGLPSWLRQNGFPEGSLHVAQSGEERDQADKFKARILNAYVQRGWRLAYAYGDSSTDFDAYAEAGIPKERVFALKRRGSRECQPGTYRVCLDGWVEHLPFIEREVANTR